MPLQATSGAASYDAFGGGVAAVPQYIEDVFSTWLYTGNGSTQTINNGIDLAGKGGLTLFKARSLADQFFVAIDSARGQQALFTGRTNSQSALASGSVNYTSTGIDFTGGVFASWGDINNTVGATFASWTFRKQPKFFDVVTYTGNSVAGRTISHNLGSAPGCIIVKRTDGSGQNWAVYHRSLGNTDFMYLNATGGAFSGAGYWNNTSPTATEFTLGTSSDVNFDGLTYVAYVFAHNAGGFGLSGTDNVISCGSYTGTGAAGNRIQLGFEPQFILYKRATGGTGDWGIHDNMRGLGVGTSSTSGSGNRLEPNTSDAETGASNFANIDATGFTLTATVADINASGSDYIYIAIRRGPMRTPTTGTSVFAPIARTGTGAATSFSTGFPADLTTSFNRGGSYYLPFVDRLRGFDKQLLTQLTNAEGTNTVGVTAMGNTSVSLGADTSFYYWNESGQSYINYAFRRAPGFFDEVCYTGTGTDDRQVTHNLGVAPELIICKSRNAAWPWWVGGSVLGSTRNGMYLNEASARQTNADAFSTNGAAFTSSYFLVSSVSAYPPNATGYTQVAYLFASCPGVSKVGSYTGNGTSQTINCGFTGGARFVLIKRTDSTGNWMVVDTARGLVSAGDPTLYLNSTAAEVTGVDWLDPDSSGFIVNQEGTMNANVSSATYIYLAIS